jgi:hypothetical protein
VPVQLNTEATELHLSDVDVLSLSRGSSAPWTRGRCACSRGALLSLCLREFCVSSILRLLQAARQIDQMLMFIKQEADEKANEIAMSADEVRAPILHPCTRSRISHAIFVTEEG